MDRLSTYLPPMGKKDTKRIAPNDLRLVLKQRLNTLMRATPELNSGPKLAAKAKVGLTTVLRARNATNATTIDTVQALANAFGIQPHELLAYPKLGVMEDTAAYRTTDLELKRVVAEWQALMPEERSELRAKVVAMANRNRSVHRHLGETPKAEDAKAQTPARPKHPIEIESYRPAKRKPR
jgi:hypothetical protein